MAPLLTALQESLDAFTEIGLGYLSLDRASGTLSGGEAQRVKMIRHLGSSLTDVTYVFDEPTVGLHPHDIQRMNELLLRLRDKGNTVLVVEHKPEAIAIADHVVDLGPGAGSAGGEVVFEGTLDGLRSSDTVTGRHLGDRAAPEARAAQAFRRCSRYAVRRRTTCATSTSTSRSGCSSSSPESPGPGKSSLIHGSVAGRDGVVLVDQAPIKGSRRSNPATYTGLLEPIRKAFAKANGVKPALFSANSEGACPTCNGAGVIFTDLAMMAGVATICDDCEGKRFQADGARSTPRRQGHQRGAGHVRRAGAASSSATGRPGRLPRRRFSSTSSTSGSATSRLGQPLTTLSGGERQRLKLATHLGGQGRHLRPRRADVRAAPRRRRTAAGLLDRLVDAGKSVIVIEHHQAVMAHADWIIDLGPGAGHDGGQVVFEGTPADLVAQRSTITGQHLADYVAR